MGKIGIAFSGAMLTMAAPALAVEVPASPATSVQQRFDSANAKLDTKDAKAALSELEALEADLVKGHSPTNLALVRIIKGQAFTILRQFDDARAAYAAALAEGMLAKSGLVSQRDGALFAYAGLLEAGLDHAGAHAQFLKLSEVSADTTTRIAALIGLARTEMFVDAPSALGHADAALALAESSELGKRELATVLGMKGRVLLNMGRPAEARDVLKRAVTLKGGLDLKVDASELAIRADTALALLWLGENNSAPRYFAYTGTGRTAQTLLPPVTAEAAPCGGTADLRPDDFAIVELTINQADGRVLTAQPIYASRAGEIAYDFARAAAKWIWRADYIGGISPILLGATRVQMRCANSQARPPLLFDTNFALNQWLESQGSHVRSGSDLVAVRPETLDAERRAAANGPIHARIAALVNYFRSPQVSFAAAASAASEALALMRASDAPLPARLSVAMANAYMPTGFYSTNSAVRLSALLAEPDIAADPVSRATINMALAENYGRDRAPKKERAAIEAVTGDSALDDHHPMKIGALVVLANLEAAEARFDTARAAYARTGLSAGQCALVDKTPVRLSSGGADNFPQTGAEWGFQGWTAVEFDITADGTTQNVRTIMAYPPEVFSGASERMAKAARYRTSFRPGADLGCGAMTTRIMFGNPR